MFKVLCITAKEGENGFFIKDDFIRDEIIFEKNEILAEVVTLKTRKGKIKKKNIKKLEKLCEKEENIYTSIDSIKKFEKNKNNRKVINYLPLVSFKKWANINAVSLSDEEFAMVVGELDDEEKSLIIKIASLVKLLTIYNCKDESLSDEIMEKTGLCVKFSKEEIKENIVIYTKESLVIENRVTGEKIHDIRVSLPNEMKNYEELPMERILENSLKNENAEKIFKKNKLKIGGFYRT